MNVLFKKIDDIHDRKKPWDWDLSLLSLLLIIICLSVAVRGTETEASVSTAERQSRPAAGPRGVEKFG